MAGITEAELLDALAVAIRGTTPDDARTVQEMADETGHTARRIRLALQRLKRDGRLMAHPTRREGIDGRQAVVTAYTIAVRAT